MSRLPSSYIISPERVPVPGAHISEGISLDELVTYQAEHVTRQANVEMDADDNEPWGNPNFDDKTNMITLGLGAAGLAALVIKIARNRLK